MAERVTLVDDLDGSPDAVTVPFSIEEYCYEIDVNEAHRQEMYDALERFMAAGRRVSGPAPPKRRRQPQIPAEVMETIRAWAREHGHRVADRGRLPQAVIDAYRAEQHDGPTVPA